MMRPATLAAVLAVAALGIATSRSRATAADVNIGVHIGTPAPPAVVVVPPPAAVVVPAPPQAIVIEPGVAAYYYGGRYFRYYNGYWFAAERHEGPWVYMPVERVPRSVVILPGAEDRRPPGHMKEVGPPPWARGRGRGHE